LPPIAHDPDPVIEAEVLEIDGKAPPQPDPNARPGTSLRRGADDDDGHASGSRPWTNWQRWPGQVRTLHPLWWPVILVVGGILLAVLLAAGLVLAVLVMLFRLLRALFR
jgi:hypothetical protein